MSDGFSQPCGILLDVKGKRLYLDSEQHGDIIYCGLLHGVNPVEYLEYLIFSKATHMQGRIHKISHTNHVIEITPQGEPDLRNILKKRPKVC
jgi:hypothetical protein